MKSAINQLILLGFVSQALSWDGYLLLFLNVALWLVCIRVSEKHPLPKSPAIEMGLLGLGCLLGYFAGRLPGQSSHFFIGHGITLFQCSRLVRELDRRERMFAIIAATVQIGVACTVVLDYRFILILVASVYVIPRALMELEAGYFATGPRRGFTMNWKTVTLILAVMVGFFLLFPRGLLGSMAGFRPPGRDQGSLLDNMLDPSRGGELGSNRVIFQVEGNNLQYLRSFALVDYDGTTWTADTSPGYTSPQAVPEEERSDFAHRRVRVKDVIFLGKNLPCDGRVVGLEGDFFRRPFRSYHNTLDCQFMWNTANNVFEYWSLLGTVDEPLLGRFRRRCLRHPEQSDRMKNWLQEQLAGISEPLDQARHLEQFFLENFTYELGAPALSRVSPTEDFIFNDRRGHCERFASALALLLRMQGIPSRVMIGYVPGPANWMTGWHNVRPRDAHAWTEAYIEGVGWVQFDATPRADMQVGDSRFTEFFDALDVFWYVNIVNFDEPAQRGLLNDAVQVLVDFPAWARANLGLLGFLALLPVVAYLYQALREWRWKGGGIKDRKKRNRVIAEHYYGQMLRSLAKQGWERTPDQTPHEFLTTLEARAPSWIDSARLVTRTFCTSRYGERIITPDLQKEIESALRVIAAKPAK